MIDDLLPGAIIIFGGLAVTEYRLEVALAAVGVRGGADGHPGDSLEPGPSGKRLPNLQRKIENMLERDRYRSLQIENAAVIVAAAVLPNIAPGTVVSRAYNDRFVPRLLPEQQSK